MKMSRTDTTALWNAVQDNDFATFSRINNRLLNPPTPLKHVPIRVYIPSSPPGDGSASSMSAASPASFKIVQTLVPTTTPANAGRMSMSILHSARQPHAPQTLGMALKDMMPELFPSSRDPVLANVILNGVSVPFDAPLVELMKEAAYPDGWLCLVVVLL